MGSVALWEAALEDLTVIPSSALTSGEVWATLTGADSATEKALALGAATASASGNTLARATERVWLTEGTDRMCLHTELLVYS